MVSIVSYRFTALVTTKDDIDGMTVSRTAGQCRCRHRADGRGRGVSGAGNGVGQERDKRSAGHTVDRIEFTYRLASLSISCVLRFNNKTLMDALHK